MADDIARLGYEIDSTQARTAAGDLDKLNAASKKLVSGYNSLESASRNLLRDDKGRFISATESAERYGSEIDALRAKYNPLYIASKQLAEGQAEIQRALELGAISSTQASAAMSKLEAQYGIAGRAAVNMGNQVAASNRHVLNMGFQFQDIGLMLASGQNPLVLAMQQGTQVAGIFNQMKLEGQSAFSAIRGGLMGLVNPLSLLTIGSIAAGAALFQWGMSVLGADKEAKTLESTLDSLESGISEINRLSKLVSTDGADALTKSYGEANDAIRSMIAAQKLLAESEALSDLQDRLEEIQKSVGTTFWQQLFSRDTGGIGVPQDVIDFENMVFNLQVDLDLTADAAERLGLAFRDAFTASNIDDQIDALAGAREMLTSIAQGEGEGAEAAKDLLKQFLETEDAARRLKESINPIPGILSRASTAAGELGGSLRAAWLNALGMSSALENAPQNIQGLENQAEQTMAAIEALKSGQDSLAASSAAYRKELEQQYELSANADGAQAKYINSVIDKQVVAFENLQKLKDEYTSLTAVATVPETTGGGVGDDRINALILSLQTEREVLDAWRIENLILLDQYNEEELALIGGKNEAKIRLEEEYRDQLKIIEEKEQSGRLNGYRNMYGDLASLMQTQSKVLFGIGKAAAIAKAVVEGKSAAVAAFEWGAEIGGLPLAYVAQAASLASTAVMIADIASTQMGGSSGGTSGISGASVPSSVSGTTAQFQPDKVVRISLDGPDWVQTIIEPIMAEIYEQTSDGTKVIFTQ